MLLLCSTPCYQALVELSVVADVGSCWYYRCGGISLVLWWDIFGFMMAAIAIHTSVRNILRYSFLTYQQTATHRFRSLRMNSSPLLRRLKIQHHPRPLKMDGPQKFGFGNSDIW